MNDPVVIAKLHARIAALEADLAHHIVTALDTNEALYKAEAALAELTDNYAGQGTALLRVEGELAAMKERLHKVAISLAMERCGDGDYEAWATVYLKKPCRASSSDRSEEGRHGVDERQLAHARALSTGEVLMSAVEDYQAVRDAAAEVGHVVVAIYLADAAIAELEAQIVSLIADWNKEHPKRLDAEAELAALKGQARVLLEAIFNAEDPEDAEEIVADAFPAGSPAWVLEWYREHPTEEEAARAEEGGGE